MTLLSEVLRPTAIADLMQPRNVVDRLSRMVLERKLMNMLFYGRPGTGKTTATLLLVQLADFEPLTINGSIQTGVDRVREDIEGFARTLSVTGKPKVCVIDECEYLSANAQAALRGVIEQYPTTRFLLTANDIDKLHPALKSRCMTICFDPDPLQAAAIIERLAARYADKLRDAGLTMPPSRLLYILRTEFPDFRRIANRIEFESEALADAA